MTKKEIREIAVKLGWELQEATEAVNKLSREDSVIKNWSKFFKLCVDANSPKERWERASASIYTQIKNKDLVRTICAWLYKTDPSFMVCALFNMADHRNERGTSPFPWRTLQMEKSFTLGFTRPLLPGFFSDNPLLNPVELSNQLLERWMTNKENDEGITPHSTLLKVIGQVGFMAFHIQRFRIQASVYSFNPLLNSLIKKD